MTESTLRERKSELALSRLGITFRERDQVTGTHIFVLEEFGHPKEERCSLLCTESLSDIEQVDDFGEEDSTLPRADRSLVEHSSFLYNSLSSENRMRSVR